MPTTNGSLSSGHSSSASEASEAKSKKENVICTEVFDENSSPTKDGKNKKALGQLALKYSKFLILVCLYLRSASSK